MDGISIRLLSLSLHHTGYEKNMHKYNTYRRDGLIVYQLLIDTPTRKHLQVAFNEETGTLDDALLSMCNLSVPRCMIDTHSSFQSNMDNIVDMINT